MLWKDSETRRLIFLRNCLKWWGLIAISDLWVVSQLFPNVDELCPIAGFLPDGDNLAKAFKVDLIDEKTLFELCHTRVAFNYITGLVQAHLGYMLMFIVARRHFRLKRTDRIVNEKKYIKRLLTKEISSRDWIRAARSTHTIKLLTGSLCPWSFACIGAILVDKELSASHDWPKYSA